MLPEILPFSKAKSRPTLYCPVVSQVSVGLIISNGENPSVDASANTYRTVDSIPHVLYGGIPELPVLPQPTRSFRSFTKPADARKSSLFNLHANATDGNATHFFPSASLEAPS